MRVLITGGGGYIGTVLVRQLLLYSAHTVTVLDRFDWGVQPIVSVIRPEWATRVQLIRTDICSGPLSTIATAVHKADAVIHLAAIVGFPACDAQPEDATATNVRGTRRIWKVLRQGQPFLFASTGSVYGKVEEACTEESPVAPLTHYGQTKLAAERLVLDAGGMAFRIATVYGLSPRMRWDLLVHNFCQLGVKGRLALYDSGARRTFLHVEDVASAFLWGLRQYQPGIYNLGAAIGNATKYQVACRVRDLTGCILSDMTGHDPDERDYQVSYLKLAQAGWTPSRLLNRQNLQPIVDVARVWEN